MDEVLTTKQAAAFLHLSPGTLQNWRSEGVGPKFHHVRRKVRYFKQDLMEFVAGVKDVQEQNLALKNRPLYLWSMEELEAVGKPLMQTLAWARKAKE